VRSSRENTHANEDARQGRFTLIGGRSFQYQTSAPAGSSSLTSSSARALSPTAAAPGISATSTANGTTNGRALRFRRVTPVLKERSAEPGGRGPVPQPIFASNSLIFASSSLAGFQRQRHLQILFRRLKIVFLVLRRP